VRWLCLAALLGCGRLDFARTGPGGGGDGGTGDGDSAGDGPDALVTGTSVCPSTVLLADDFQDGVTAPEWTVMTATDLTVAETAGVLRVTFAANSGPNERAGYRQTTASDYSAACVIAEITAIPAASQQAASSWVRVGPGPSDNAAFSFDNGEVRSDLHNGASIRQVDLRPFDPIAHRFLRMRMTATTTYWEASPDGVTFTLLGSVVDTLGIAAATQLDLEAQSLSATHNAGTAEWASVQVLVPP
jgi:hypothetical protein